MSRSSGPAGPRDWARRTADFERHLADLESDSYESAQDRAAREDVFRKAVDLLSPVVTDVLEEVGRTYAERRGSDHVRPGFGRVRAHRDLEPRVAGPARRPSAVRRSRVRPRFRRSASRRSSRPAGLTAICEAITSGIGRCRSRRQPTRRANATSSGRSPKPSCTSGSTRRSSHGTSSPESIGSLPSRAARRPAGWSDGFGPGEP